jgi:hypothetical protein
MDGENGSTETTGEAAKKNVPRIVTEAAKNFDRATKKIDKALAAFVKTDSEKNQSGLESAIAEYSVAWRMQQTLARVTPTDAALSAAIQARAVDVIAKAQPRDAAKQIADLVSTVLTEAQPQDDGN